MADSQVADSCKMSPFISPPDAPARHPCSNTPAPYSLPPSMSRNIAALAYLHRRVGPHPILGHGFRHRHIGGHRQNRAAAGFVDRAVQRRYAMHHMLCGNFAFSAAHAPISALLLHLKRLRIFMQAGAGFLRRARQHQGIFQGMEVKRAGVGNALKITNGIQFLTASVRPKETSVSSPNAAQSSPVGLEIAPVAGTKRYNPPSPI